MANNVQAGVVGCGWAGSVHAEAYKRNPAIQLAAVCDEDINRATQLASRMGCRAYADLSQMLKKESMQMVSITSPADRRAEFGMQCLEHGIAVFCEKPISTNLQDATKLVRLAEEKKLPLGVNFNRRFATGYVKARNLLLSDEPIHFINVVLAQNIPPSHIQELRNGFPEDFLMTDSCAHLLDLAMFLSGEEISDITALGQRAKDSSLWTDIQIGFHLSGGGVGSILCSLAGPEWGQLPIERLDIATSTRRIIVRNINQEVVWFGHNDTVSHSWTPSVFTPVGYVDSIITSISTWAKAVIDGKPSPVSGEEGLRNAQLCEEVLGELRRKEKKTYRHGR